MVVVGYRGDDVRAALPGRLGVEVVENPGWEEGIASSLRTVLTVLTPRADVEAVCVGLADQPHVECRGLSAGRDDPRGARVPTYAGHPGNPVKLARSLGRRRWRSAATSAPGRSLGVVPSGSIAPTPASAADVDTLEDLERLQQEDQ